MLSLCLWSFILKIVATLPPTEAFMTYLTPLINRRSSYLRTHQLSNLLTIKRPLTHTQDHSRCLRATKVPAKGHPYSQRRQKSFSSCLPCLYRPDYTKLAIASPRSSHTFSGVPTIPSLQIRASTDRKSGWAHARGGSLQDNHNILQGH